MTDLLLVSIEKTMHDARLVEGSANYLTNTLTLGEDKRLAATARTHMQTAYLYLKELRESVANRVVTAEQGK